MSSTVSTQHPAVVLRSSYRQLRALLAIATIAVVGLTVAVVVLAINSVGTGATASSAARATPSAISANPNAELGAKLDHRGLKTAAQPGTLGTYGGHY